MYQKYGGAIFDRPVGGIVQVKVGFASGKSEVVGEYINELYVLASPPLQEQDVKVALGAAIGDSKVIGRHIGRMVSVVETLEAEDLLHAAALNPLKKLEELRPEERVVVLIDALDDRHIRKDCHGIPSASTPRIERCPWKIFSCAQFSCQQKTAKGKWGQKAQDSDLASAGNPLERACALSVL